MHDEQNLPASLLLDRSVLQTFCEDICDNQPDQVTGLIEMYLNSVDQLLKAMEEALADKDAKRLRRVSHSLKSSSRIIGVETLADRCEEIEEFARQGQLEAAAPLVGQVLAQEKQVRPLLTAQLKALGMFVEQE